MKKKRAILVFVLIVALTSFYSVFGWEFTHHGQGAVRSIAASESGERILLLMSKGGFYLTNDGGDTWTQINDRIENGNLTHHYAAYVVDPAADTLIVNAKVTPNNVTSMYQSFDGGETWFSYDYTSFDYGDRPEELYIARAPDTYVYAPCENIFGRSVDSGQTWETFYYSDVTAGTRGILIDPDDETHIYAYGQWDYPWNDGGIAESFDAGETWTNIVDMFQLRPECACDFRDLILLDDGSLLAIATYDYREPAYPFLLISENQGVDWRWIQTQGLPTQRGWRSILPVPEVPGRVLMGGIHYGLWASDDYGVNWYRMLNGLPVYPVNATVMFRNEFSGDLYVDIESEGLWRSQDFGESWSLVQIPDIGVNDFYEPIPTEYGVWHSGRNGSLAMTEGAGTEFHEIERVGIVDTVESMKAINFPGSRIGYLYGRSSIEDSDITVNAVWSDDGGQTWTEGARNTIDSLYAFNRVEAFPHGDGIALLGDNGYDTWSYSADMGATWQQIAYPLSRRLGDMVLLRDQIYAVDFIPPVIDVFRADSVNGDWESLDFPEPDVIRVSPKPLVVDDTLLVQAGLATWAYLPDDTWQRRGPIPEPDDPFDATISSWDRVITDTDTFIVGCNRYWPHAFYVSHDYGRSWEQQDFDMPWRTAGQIIVTVAFDPWRQRLWVDTEMEMAYLDDFPSSVDEPWVFQPVAPEILTAYPNPFNASTTVHFALDTPQQVKLDVSDVLGRRVATLADGVMTPGQHAVPFDAAELASGTYYVHLSTSQHSVNHKLVLVK